MYDIKNIPDTYRLINIFKKTKKVKPFIASTSNFVLQKKNPTFDIPI